MGKDGPEGGEKEEEECQLKDLAGALIDLLAGPDSTSRRFAAVSIIRWLGHVALLFNLDNGVNGLGKDLIHTAHLLTTALHIDGAHALCHALALFRRAGSQTLCLQELDACSLVAQI